jgi:phage baseplate assembly protein W
MVKLLNHKRVKGGVLYFMNIHEEMGVDVNRKWQLWNNDLILVNDFDNLYQAIYNRLMTTLNDMSYFYDEYGSRLKEYLGQPMKEHVLDSIAEEVVTELNKEPRISSSEVEVVKINSYKLAIHITCFIDEDDTFETNFVFNTLSNNLEYVGNEVTQIILDTGISTCPKTHKMKGVKVGEPFDIKCKILNSYGNPVPIGIVDFSYGNIIFMSKEITNNNANIQYTFPEGTPLGTYRITAHYRGIGRFNNSTNYIDIEVTDKFPTETKYRQNLLTGYKGQKIHFPVTVNDVLGGKVNEGNVEYSIVLGDDLQLPSKIVAENMYTDSVNHAIFSNAFITDKWGGIIDEGIVNFYIENGDGLAIATQTLLDNLFMDYNHQIDNSYFYRSTVKDVFGKPVHGGQINYSYRKHGNTLTTNTLLPDETKVYHGIDNVFESTVTDEDNLNVTEGEVEYYIRHCSRCHPYPSKTITNTAYLKDQKLFTHSTVTDEDDIPLKKGSITYDFSETPIGFKTPDRIEKNTKYGAAIVDDKGNIIDIGNVISQTNKEGQSVTSYVSNDSVQEDDDLIRYEIISDIGNDNNGKKENRD